MKRSVSSSSNRAGRKKTILIDRGMKKKDLEEAAGITHYQMYKLANDKDITTDVIGAICTALEVSVDDILEFVPVKEK